MAVTYRTADKAARMNLIKTAIDSGGAAGTLEIGTTGMGAVLSSHTLSYPCATSTSTDTLQLLSINSATTSAGTPAAAQIKNSAGTVIISGLTVAVTGTPNVNITVDISPFTNGGTATVTGLSITHA